MDVSFLKWKVISGVLVAKKSLFRNRVPDGCGGGSVFFVSLLISLKEYYSQSCILPFREVIVTDFQNEPRCEKTGLRGFRPGPTQTGLCSHRRRLEA